MKPLFLKNACTRVLFSSIAVVLLLHLTNCTQIETTINFSLEGTWEVQAALVSIDYNPAMDERYPPAVRELLNAKIKDMEFELKTKPAKIIFHPYSSKTNSYPVDFIYSSLSIPVSGTYAQNKADFEIFNIYPKGIKGISDNEELNLFYEREHLLRVFDNCFLSGEDPPPSYYYDFIIEMVGIALYRRIN